MNDPEPCGIKQEDIEQQIGWCLFLILKVIILKAANVPKSIIKQVHNQSVFNIFKN